MAGISGNGKLRQWLIEQVDGGKYPGLVWEDREKSTFRIPWKHAGKQDYNREEDAALFKAWALFKGKYREGIDKPDPPTWKTRLRCALNKSNDFEELVEKSQLDTSEPYKVYRVIPEGTKRVTCERTSTMTSPHSFSLYSTYTPLQNQVSNFLAPSEKGWRDLSEQAPFPDFYYPYSSNSYTAPWDPGYQISNSFYNCSGFDPSPSTFNLDQSMRSVAFSDPRLQVSVYSGDSLIRETTVFSTEGCRLAPYDENPNYGGPELVQLPQGEGTELEHGVLVWMAHDGLYARRLCNARVYWEPMPTSTSLKPNKLERNQTSKLVDIQQFITDLQGYYLQARFPPCFQVLLYFEQSHDIHGHRRPISVQVEPLFARQLFILSQQSHMRAPDNAPATWEQQNYYTGSSHQQENLQD
ncbi:interferon regulatory factor 4 isoform X2 [Clarias gariepinus]|uniref:interferon regulatory factor 4 isoform X2 n=1 Tax=Clarias gariepinus TaxID=13013 RepID=UPI00234C35E4|nr:interferon regulatory factor 4 isoform X2 [Clarias gariepinus]